MEINVEVVHALPTGAIIKIYRLAAPATVGDALRLARADPDFAGIDVEHSPVGVFGKVVEREQVLIDEDRIELYRSLAADPKSARRARAKSLRKTR